MRGESAEKPTAPAPIQRLLDCGLGYNLEPQAESVFFRG
jgi:hypothetical protein